MINRTLCNNGIYHARVSRRKAINAFSNGIPVIATPVNMDPFNPYWSTAITLDPEKCDSGNRETYFKRMVNSLEYFNCNHECGYYAAFYIQVNR